MEGEITAIIMMIKEFKYTKVMQDASTSSSQENKRMLVVPPAVLRNTGTNASAL